MKNPLPKVAVALIVITAIPFGGARIASALTSSNSSATTSISLPQPAIPGVARLPGHVAAVAQPSPNMGVLAVKPDTGLAGTPMRISGSGLPKKTRVTLTWSTANATWNVGVDPTTVNYLGRSSTPLNVVLAKTTTSKTGSFNVKLRVPDDWGGVHDIYAVVKKQQLAHGGFLVGRKFTISPKRGPIGTPITITYRGFAPTVFEGGAALLYDNHTVGELMANWTRGTARVVIRAAGPVGRHLIEIGDAVSFLYLNLQQAPDSWAVGGTEAFTVTKDNGRPKPSINWPVKVAPTIRDRTTLQRGVAHGSHVHMKLGSSSGQIANRIGLTARGLTPRKPIDLEWSSVVGSRVNCKHTCWAFVSVPLRHATPAHSTLKTKIRVPSSLGGWHVVQLIQGGKVMAQVPFYVKESIVGHGVSSLAVKAGQHFTVHLKGVGWTQLDNTVGVTYDNSYVGYGCGFASNGDVVLNLHATGGPGTHLIDLYPMLYTVSPSFPSTPYGLVPVLTYARDYPGLAMGYKLPAIRLAITVVK